MPILEELKEMGNRFVKKKIHEREFCNEVYLKFYISQHGLLVANIVFLIHTLSTPKRWKFLRTCKEGNDEWAEIRHRGE